MALIKTKEDLRLTMEGIIGKIAKSVAVIGAFFLFSNGLWNAVFPSDNFLNYKKTNGDWTVSNYTKPSLASGCYMTTTSGRYGLIIQRFATLLPDYRRSKDRSHLTLTIVRARTDFTFIFDPFRDWKWFENSYAVTFIKFDAGNNELQKRALSFQNAVFFHANRFDASSLTADARPMIQTGTNNLETTETIGENEERSGVMVKEIIEAMEKSRDVTLLRSDGETIIANFMVRNTRGAYQQFHECLLSSDAS